MVAAEDNCHYQWRISPAAKSAYLNEDNRMIILCESIGRFMAQCAIEKSRLCLGKNYIITE